MSLSHRTTRRGQLPDGFVSIRDLLDGKRGLNTTVDVIGVVTDFRTPMSTMGKDWKCQIRLYDYSTEDANEDSILLNVFRPENEMPDAGLCDIVVILQAKLQRHNESMSLLTKQKTDIHIYSASKIPKPPQEASGALKPPSRKTTRSPTKLVHEFVSSLYHSIDKAKVPTDSEFEVMKLKSGNVIQKFSELQNVRDGIFVDAVVQIVKQPYDSGDKYTVWVSDYTENAQFFHHEFKGIEAIAAQDDDARYLANLYNNARSEAEWPGPFGKRSMQITCFEPHASFIRERNLSAGSWVVLRNLQIKFGHNDANLEGFLREDRGAAGLKINISCLDPTDMDTPDPRLKEAIRRKREYERAKKEQLKGITEATKTGKQRKSDMNSKKKRQAKRAVKQAEYHEARQTAIPDLNSQVKCENQNKAASTVEGILKPVYLQTIVDGQDVKLKLPFTNVNYRVNVRVVNFMPSNIEDFAYTKRSTEYAILSDNDESDSGSEEEMMVDFSTARQWEWRFFLELEDATPDQEKKTVWVVVDNQAAQCLMDLDASDLKRNPDDVEALRQRLFLLWGELEEHKSREAAANKKGRVARATAQNGLPPDSSDDEGRAQRQQQQGEKTTTEVNNRPFSCCLRQYGVKVPESDPCEADAGTGKRWQRMFGLFGTRITSA